MTPFGGPDRRSAGPRRADNGNGNGNGSWTSLKAWSTAIGVVGIPGAIAIFLVYLGGTRVPELERKIQSLEITSNRIVENQDKILTRIETMIRVSFRACSNAAKDDASRQRCFEP